MSTIIPCLLFLLKLTLVCSDYEPPSKEEQLKGFQKLNETVEPFRRNLTECARQVRASGQDVENFLKRIPQQSLQGKCFVACILKRNAIIKNNKINKHNLLDINKAVYGEDHEVMARLRTAITECTTAVEDIFEICEYATVFNDCMHMKMEHILDRVTMERRMEALGQMTSNPDEWTEEDDDVLKLLKDEL